MQGDCSFSAVGMDKPGMTAIGSTPAKTQSLQSLDYFFGFGLGQSAHTKAKGVFPESLTCEVVTMIFVKSSGSGTAPSS